MCPSWHRRAAAVMPCTAAADFKPASAKRCCLSAYEWSAGGRRLSRLQAGPDRPGHRRQADPGVQVGGRAGCVCSFADFVLISRAVVPAPVAPRMVSWPGWGHLALPVCCQMDQLLNLRSGSATLLPSVPVAASCTSPCCCAGRASCARSACWRSFPPHCRLPSNQCQSCGRPAPWLQEELPDRHRPAGGAGQPADRLPHAG